MTPALLAALSGAALTLLAVLGALLAIASSRRAQRALDDSRADVAALRSRVDELEATRHAAVPAAAPARPSAEYVITTAGTGGDAVPAEPTVADRVVLSATFGEPLVKVVSLLYGVRRALSAEQRNRIGFAMRQEVKRARKQRRRETREARRALHAEQRAELAQEDAREHAQKDAHDAQENAA